MSDQNNENTQGSSAEPQVPAGQPETQTGSGSTQSAQPQPAQPQAVPSAVPAAAPVSAAVTKAELKAAKAKAKVDAKLAKVREKEAQIQAKADAKAQAKAAKSKKSEPAPTEPAKPEAASTAAPAVPDADSRSAEAKIPDAPAEPAAPAPAAKSSAVPSVDDAAQRPATEVPAQDKADAGSLPEPSADAAASAPQKNGTSPAPSTTSAAAAAAAVQPASPNKPAPEAGKAAEAKAAEAAPTASKKTKGSTTSAEQADTSEAPETAQKPQESPKAARRREKLERARAAAARDAEHSPTRRKTGAVLLSLAAVLASGGLVAAGSLLAPSPDTTTLPAAVTSLPAGDALSVCASTPQLLKGVDGTDPQFAPGAKEISSNLRSVVISDLAKRIPGSTFSALGGSSRQTLTERIDDAEASESRSADDQGLTGRSAKVSTVNNADGKQLFEVQPLGQLPSIGSTLRSYQAKDGDLAGLAAASCQVPASTWRFTGLQTTTGSTSVLHLANPTSTSAQVAVDLRGPEGPIDTSTLQNVVIAPGEQRAIVLGGYAQDLSAVAATVTSTGGKVTGYVQQAALRGLTPSGVDLVAGNASASNTQVIPGVWIDNKNNSAKLSKDNKSLVPQLHVAAAGAQGAGYKVKVLGAGGEVAASFERNLAASSNATSVQNLDQLAGGYYTLVVEADAPVTASVKMVRGADPKDASDTAWAVSSNPLAGNQVMPLSANGTGKFVIAATDADSSIDAVVVAKDGKLQKTQKLNIKAGTSTVFDPRETSEDAQAVIFSSDANAYIGQVILGSEQSIGWASMPAANAGREGIVVNVGG
ncbi:hypothetical protein DFO58_1499 [Arthrobacter sp. AG1021]|uniref:DUF5719 family protein n=1 Tax=Arthrobacter sp. AG1021 TaxID=2183908 RepID=UPI000EB526C3|nr:DUF5719 family protein [Arthrobacter sp. AG1021]RKS20950.1 hypothetical protein DFO58_1499 [Arthrobacter sp. AG1021]